VQCIGTSCYTGQALALTITEYILKYEINSIKEFEQAVFEAVQRRILAFSAYTTFPEFDRQLDTFISHIANRVCPTVESASSKWRLAWFLNLQVELARTI